MISVPHFEDVPDGPILIGSPLISMPTALAYIFSDGGFVVAADGFEIVRERGGLRVASGHAQKIFRLTGTDREVACSFHEMARLLNDAGDAIAFDFIPECISAAQAVKSINQVGSAP